MRNEARMRDGLATPRYWWVQAKIIGIDGGYNSDPEYIPPPPSLYWQNEFIVLSSLSKALVVVIHMRDSPVF